MLGSYYQDPVRLSEELATYKMPLAAIALVLDWLHPRETEGEQEKVAEAIRFLKHFPGTLLALCQVAGKDRSHLKERQQNALACINAVARRVADAGISCAYHPNSPPGSVFRTEEDYQILLNGLDSKVVGFAPDAGHIAKGGMDAVKIFQEYRPLIRHIHFKDISSTGEWAEMGQGVIDFPAIVSHLHATGYEGWIMVEDESPRAESDPDTVTLDNGRYVREKLMPLAQGRGVSPPHGESLAAVNRSGVQCYAMDACRSAADGLE